MKKAFQFILYLLIAVVAVNAIHTYGFTPLGERLLPAMKLNFETHRIGIYTHVFAAVIALVLGPFQFWGGLRRRHPELHRMLGKIYLALGVFVGGLSGLYMSVFAFGGAIVQIGFGSLALLWLYTAYTAYQAIRAGKVERHRAFMVRNYALTLAAVSLRVYLPLSMMAGMEFVTAYSFIAWLCWIPNLLVAEMLIARRRADVKEGRGANTSGPLETA